MSSMVYSKDMFSRIFVEFFYDGQFAYGEVNRFYFGSYFVINFEYT